MKKLLLVVVSLLLLVFPLHAQDFLSTLAQVPDTDEAKVGFISYVDYRAMESTREGALRPQSWQDWDSSRTTPAGGLWLATTFGISSGPAQIFQNFFLADEWQELLGFDFFDIDRAIEYGRPPAMGIVLNGEFNTNSIATAYFDRDYTATEFENAVLLCPEDGCDTGLKQNIMGRDPRNPFGGNLGRSEPLIATDTFLIDSPAEPIIEDHIGLIEGTQSSILENPAYLAVAESALLGGEIIQAQIIPLDDIVTIAPDTVIDALGAENWQTIPAFELAILTDTATETEQMVLLGLLYSSAEEAEAALTELPNRINTYNSIVVERSFNELLEELNADTTFTVYESTTTGKFVALVIFSAPLASSEETENGFERSSRVFRLLIDMVYRRDALWLTPEIELE